MKVTRNTERDYYNELCDDSQKSVSAWRVFATSSLAHCLNHHSKCQIPQEAPWSPRRLIEITSLPQSTKLRLVTSRPPEPYTALSHCWGSVHVFSLTLKNLKEMKADIPFSQLPKTFQDAITMTAWLNGEFSHFNTRRTLE